MYINMCIYVYIHTYVKWMSTGLMLACHKSECNPVSCHLVIKMDECRSCHKNECSPVSRHLVIKMDAVLSHTILP